MPGSGKQVQGGFFLNMSCSGITKDFLIKKEKIDLEADQNQDQDQDSLLLMGFDKAAAAKKLQEEQQKIITNHDLMMMSETTLSMFRKYLFSKTQNNIIGKSNMEESEEVIKKKHGRPLLPPKFGTHMPRPASLLEQELLPGIRSNAKQSESDGKSSAAQLTIFYAGAVNVYDNVPADKAQAIMLLAGKSCVSKPIALELPKTEMKKKLPFHCSNLTSVCKLQAELPIARKLSLQYFLEKRRKRITSKSPYSCSPSAEHMESETREDDHSISLTPFPARLGYFFPKSANKGC